MSLLQTMLVGIAGSLIGGLIFYVVTAASSRRRVPARFACAVGIVYSSAAGAAATYAPGASAPPVAGSAAS